MLALPPRGTRHFNSRPTTIHRAGFILKYWHLHSPRTWAGFCAAAVAAPLVGACAAYLLQPQPPVHAPTQAAVAANPTASIEPSATARAMVRTEPTATTAPVAREAFEPDVAPANLRAVAALTPLPTPQPPKAPTAEPTHAPESIATAAKMLGFVWNGGNVRIEPGVDQPIVGSVDAGDLVELLEERDGWWRIRTMAFEGWLSKTLLIVSAPLADPLTPPAPAAPAEPVVVAPVAPVAAPVAPVAAPAAPAAVAAAPVVSFRATMSNGGNVRSGPGLGHTVIGNFHAGTAVDLLDTKAGWWLVRIGSLQGWMSGTLLKVPGEALKHWKVPDVVAAPAAPPKPAAPMQAAAQTTSLWAVRAVPGQLAVLPDVVAPNPRLVGEAAGPFLRARTRVLRASGVDYLGVLGDAYRHVAFESSKPGVASMSWHKAGRAIDVAQSFNVKGVQGVVFIRDAAAPRYYRVLIRCAKQDGSLGVWYGPKALGARKGYYTDVTTILLEEGFRRIAPSGGVSEAWHYEYTGGLTWSQAMRQLYPLKTLRALWPGVFR
jgi:SH3-like domain-containing protein